MMSMASTAMWMTVMAASASIKNELVSDIAELRHTHAMDVMEVCTPADSGLMEACLQRGLYGKRLSNWSGHDLATEAGTQRALERSGCISFARYGGHHPAIPSPACRTSISATMSRSAN